MFDVIFKNCYVLVIIFVYTCIIFCKKIGRLQMGFFKILIKVAIGNKVLEKAKKQK